MLVNPKTLGGASPNVQQCLASIGVSALAYGSERCCLVASVARENARSLENLVTAGFEAIDSPEWLRACRRSWCKPEVEKGVVDLMMKCSHAVNHSDRVTALASKPVLSRVDRNTGETTTFSLRVDLPWFPRVGNGVPWLTQGKATWEDECPPHRVLGKNPAWVDSRSPHPAGI
jgi:hypothetical protein